MNSKVLLTLLLILTARVFAAAPSRIDGNIYYETVSSVGPGVARGTTTFAVVLKSDGTFSGLFSLSNTPFIAPGQRIDSQVDGTYSYRKIDDQPGTLILDGIPLNGGDGGNSRTLQFVVDNGGTIPTTVLGVTASFRIVPLAARAPLSNCSNRSFVRASGGSAFTGFVITSGGSGLALVRAVGPGLSPFGITDYLRTPTLKIVNTSANVDVGSNSDWASDSMPAIRNTGNIVGAFPFPAGSKDAALIVSLLPGAYVAQVSSNDANDSGQVLIEVYLLP